MHDQARKPRTARLRPIPQEAWTPLGNYAAQAREHLVPGSTAARPDLARLIEAAKASPRLAAVPPELVSLPEGPAITLLLAKPRGEGISRRILDPEALFLILVATIGGGRIALEPKGVGGGIYYVRLYIDGYRPDGQLRRVHLARVLADTAILAHTVEPKDHHDLRRCKLGRYRKPSSEEPLGLYGTDDLREDAISRFQEVTSAAPDRLHGLTEPQYVQMLDDAIALLRAVPLGQSGEGRP